MKWLQDNLKRKLKGLVLAGAMLFPSTSYADGASGVAELSVGEKSVTSDIKFLQPLDRKLSLFLRNRNNWNYETEKVTPFTLSDINYNLKGGLDLTFEAQFASDGTATPRLGLEYFKSFKKDFTLYGLGTVNLDDSLRNFEGVFLARYTLDLKSNLKLLSTLEAVINVGEQESGGFGHNFTALRTRLGFLHENGIGYGLSFDTNLSGNDPKIDQIGLFIRKEF